MNIKICKWCEKSFDTSFKPKGWMANHVRWCSKNPTSKRIKIKEYFCIICGKVHFNRKRKTCSDECYEKSKRRPKEICSIKRKEFLKNNKNKHNWSLYKNKESEPERLFKEIISKYNLNIIQYYIPPENDRFFELDFADKDNKIAFEINGNQHYEFNGDLKEYYKKRHDYFKYRGWNLIEIHYLICFNEDAIKKIIEDAYNNSIEFLDILTKEIINYKIEKKKLKEQKKLKQNKDRPYFKENIKQRNRKEYFRDRQEIVDKKEIFKIDLVLNSGIDFSKFGWVNKVSKIIDKIPQKVHFWMKRYMLDFYEEKCFKRKKHNSI